MCCRRLQAAHLRAQPGLGHLDLREHVIEGVGELIQLEQLRGLRANAVVLSIRHGARRLGEVEDRPRDLPLLQTRDEQRDQRAEREDTHRDEAVHREAIVERIEIGRHHEHAERLALELHRIEHTT